MDGLMDGWREGGRKEGRNKTKQKFGKWNDGEINEAKKKLMNELVNWSMDGSAYE